MTYNQQKAPEEKGAHEESAHTYQYACVYIRVYDGATLPVVQVQQVHEQSGT